MPARRPDVVVVLGASLGAGGKPSVTVRRRMARGVEVFRASGAAAMVVTGGPSRGGVSEAEAMRDLALVAGIAADRIVIEPTARSTFENASRSARIMAERGWSRALVVSDRVHLPRALLAFHSVGVRARGRGVRVRWRDGPFRTFAHYFLYEIVALAWYALLIATRRTPQ